MLPQFYQTHLQQHLTQTQFLVLSLLLNVLQLSKQVKLEHLARMFPYPITIKISYLCHPPAIVRNLGLVVEIT